MTHSTLRITELAPDAEQPDGYRPTDRHLVRASTAEQPATGRVITHNMTRDRDTGAEFPVTPEQRDVWEELAVLAATDPGAVQARLDALPYTFHQRAEIVLDLDLNLVQWLLGVASGVVRVEVWTPNLYPEMYENGPQWTLSCLPQVEVASLFVTVVGRVSPREVPPPGVEATHNHNRARSTAFWVLPAPDEASTTVVDDGYTQRWATTNPPPLARGGAGAAGSVTCGGEASAAAAGMAALG